MSPALEFDYDARNADPTWPPELREQFLLCRWRLSCEKPADALAGLPGGDDPWLRNARAVCRLRLGQPTAAAAELRPALFDRTGLALRRDVEPPFLANYAEALLAEGNTDGFFSILSDIRDRKHPAVVRLDDAVRQWKRGLTFGQRLLAFVGIGGPQFSPPNPPGLL
jgi:hypothetical protein